MAKKRKSNSIEEINKNTKVIAQYAQLQVMSFKIGLVGFSLFIAFIIIALLSGARFG